mgnify:CR=1 FL=1
MKLWGSVRQGAAKVAFEADKMVRVRKQEQAIADVQKQVQAVYTTLGESVLSLFRAGMVDHPQIAAANQQVASLTLQVSQLQDELERIKAEEFEAAPMGADASVVASSGQPVPPAAPVPPVAPAPAASISPEAQSAPVAPASRVCPNCGAAVPPTGAFCPECGQSLKSAQ